MQGNVGNLIAPFAVAASSIAIADSTVMKLELEKRENLRFKASTLFEDRKEEAFDLVPLSPDLEAVVLITVEETIRLLPSKYFPKSFRVSFENTATLIAEDGRQQTLPLALILTQQIPQQNLIRFGTFEIEDDLVSIRSILAHEMGHMLIEWACRKEGITSPDQSVISHWSKPIYEGVADFVASIVTNRTVIGNSETWFYRDILKYPSLEEAQNPKESLADLAERGLTSVGLIPSYSIYQDWVSKAREYLEKTGTKDPYSEGTWVARNLWELSKIYSNETVFRAVLETALTGVEYRDSRAFLEAIQKLLGSRP